MTNAAGFNAAGETPEHLDNFESSFPEPATNSGYKASFHYISKKIGFIRPTWLTDYQVDVSYLNCLPQTNQGGYSPGSWSGAWVEKGWDYFIIYVAFPAFPTTGQYEPSNSNRVGTYPAPYQQTVVTSSSKKKKTSASVTISARNGGRFSAFAVMTEEILQSSVEPYSTTAGHGYTGNPRIGLCTYPTVQWDFKGVNEETSEWNFGDLNSPNDQIVLMP